MVIQQPNLNPLADLLASSEGKRRVSRTMLYAITAAGLLHAGLAYYLYQQRMSVPSQSESSETGAVVITPYRPSQPKPEPVRKVEKVTQPPRKVTLHETMPRPDVQPTQTSPFTPVDGAKSQGEGPVVDYAPTPPQPPTKAPQTVAPPGPATIVDPKWISRPSADQLARYYPPRAATLDKTGRAVMECNVLASGKVTGCAVSSEDPQGYGFGRAALQLAQFFKMSPQTRNGEVIDGAHVTIRLAFRLD